ncbi:MAG: hypothetical protein QGH07_14395, partial [Alphaproteobacteria bacterium]|nr:hypothetical protein [Alphaproteobacteria bacterium]
SGDLISRHDGSSNLNFLLGHDNRAALVSDIDRSQITARRIFDVAAAEFQKLGALCLFFWFSNINN